MDRRDLDDGSADRAVSCRAPSPETSSKLTSSKGCGGRKLLRQEVQVEDQPDRFLVAKLVRVA